MMDGKKPMPGDENDSYLKKGMKDESEKVHKLAVMKAKMKVGGKKPSPSPKPVNGGKPMPKGYKPSKERVNYPFGSVPKNDPFVKNHAEFLKKQANMNKKFGN